MQVYADADTELSRRLTLTAEGFLVCRDAVFARTGQQEYFTAEVPTLQPDANGWIIVNRPEREVFDPGSLKSFVGKPVVLQHPDGEDMFVHPENVRRLQIGTVLNARRGEGEFRNNVVGDIMVTNGPAIDLIRRGTHRSLSVGYDASYRQHIAGFADQHSIRVNHIALLPTGEARCGDQCRVLDRRAKPPPRAAMTDEMRRAKRAHEEWSRARMAQMVAAQKQFWERGQPRH
jgi:hypothetical protein